MVERAKHGIRQLDVRITNWMAKNGPVLLRWSLGIIFLWFGALKFFPGISSAEDIATRTMSVITFHQVSPEILRNVLAAWECAIGIGLIAGVAMRAVLLLLFLQMAGTLTPLFFFTDELFTIFPFAPTLEGQYIVKNLVLISAAIMIGGTVRGGAVVADPQIAAIGRQKMDAENRQPLQKSG